MLIVYLSLTGNVRRFVDKVEMSNLELNLKDNKLAIFEDYIIICPTYSDEITNAICEFIEYKSNINHLVGFVGSGNLNFDNDYCFNARDLSKKYDKPLLFKFEFSGTDNEVKEFKKVVDECAITRIK